MALQPSCPAMESPLSPTFGCQRKKCKCICYSSAPRAFFQALCSQARCSVGQTERISITNIFIGQWFQVLYTKVIFRLGLSLFKFHSHCPEKQWLHFCNKQLETLCFYIFLVSLCFFYSHYIPSKPDHILHLLHLANLWLIKRQITSISLWRIEYFCIVKAVVSSSKGTHCPFLSLSPLE